MKKVLVDVNVILDFLAKRASHKEAAQIFAACESNTIKGFVSTRDIITMAWFLSDRIKNKSAKNVINDILDLFSAPPINEKILLDAFNSRLSDLEDAVMEQIAIKENLDYIITNNTEDFKKSRVKAIKPIEFISFIKNP